MEAVDFADEMIKLEQNLDPDFYQYVLSERRNIRKPLYGKFYAKMEKRNTAGGWEVKTFEQKPELKEQADRLKTTLEQVKLIPPVDLKPFVYVRISEHPDIPLEEAIPLNQAVELFGKLDWQAVGKEMVGYYKTNFEICFSQRGKSCLIPGARILVTGKEISWIM